MSHERKHPSLVKGFQEIFHHNCIQISGNSCTNDPGVTMEYFKVKLSHDFNRKINPDFEPKIASSWANHCKANPNLFNASKFRLQGLALEKNCNMISMDLGVTCYRDFMCTNMSKDCSALLDYGKDYYNDQQACMSDKIGVGAIVVSCDNQVLFMQRSMVLAEEAGMVGVPAGHPEPKEIGLPDDIGTDQDSLCDSIPSEKVIYELFYSVIKEVRDEVNIPEKCLSWPLLTGIIREDDPNGKPNACFFVRCSLTGDEIRCLYNEGGPEAYESTELILVDLQDVKNYSSSPKMQELIQQATPSSRACVYFFIT